MIRPSRASLGATLLLPIILVVAACSGGTATATPPPGGTTATPTPPPGGVDTTPAPNTGGAIRSFDLSTLGGAIPGLDSYQVTASTKGVKQYSSVVVTKPELAKEITTYNDDGTVDNRYIIVGKDAWQADGADGAFSPVPAALATTMLLAFDPMTMLGAFAHLDFTKAAADQGAETKNGIPTHRFQIDGTILGATLPAGASVNLWVADAGYLVAFEINSGTADGDNLQIELSNVNDPANVVTKPS